VLLDAKKLALTKESVCKGQGRDTPRSKLNETNASSLEIHHSELADQLASCSCKSLRYDLKG
jgi:hypothetical protein